MRLPRATLLPSFLRELFSARTLQREPETALVMEDAAEVGAYAEAGRTKSLQATYLFMNAHISQVIHGCARVVDLACGPGTLLCEIASANPSITFVGVDLSGTMLREAERTAQGRRLSNVSFMEGDITRLTAVGAHSFDGVISSFALHHLPTVQDLERCFREIRRILQPGGAIFLNDFGRLKSVKSVVHMAYLTAADEPYLFTLDKERSMRAAFTLDDFQRLAGQEFPAEVRVHSTFKVPLVILARTPPRPLPVSMAQRFEERRLALLPAYRRDLDDLRFFFYLDGVKEDLFGPFVPGLGQLAKWRMLEFATLPVLGTIQTVPLRRAWAVGRLLFRVASAYAAHRWSRWWNPAGAKASQSLFFARLSSALERELGALKGPLMKFGQMVSYLTENLPPALRQSLEPLQHRSPPLDGAVIRRIVEKELRQPIAKLFSEWNDTPLAAASISQLHLARLPDDRLVVVKVRYPKIQQAVRSDFLLLGALRPLLRRLWGLSNTGELLRELEELILSECDFQKAAAYQEEFRSIFQDDPEIVIPRVFSDYTTSSVLTMDYVEGKTYDEFKKSSTQAQRNRAGEIIWRMAAVSINRHCLYNADPHPGNYLFVGEKAAFVDFGFTKRFSPVFMDLWKKQTIAGCQGDFETFTQVNRQLGYERSGHRLDHRAMYETYRRIVYKAWMNDEVFRFTKEFVSAEMRALLNFNRSTRGALRMPVEFVSILRLLWGQHALLADLEAESNWHRIVFPLLNEQSTRVTHP